MSAENTSRPGSKPGRSRIAALNDAFRLSLAGGRVVETPAVQALTPAERTALLLAVRRFKAFDKGNDPYGERDFGAVEVAGQRWSWKIDAYDLSLSGASPDPGDPRVTARVLTLMHAEEY